MVIDVLNINLKGNVLKHTVNNNSTTKAFIIEQKHRFDFNLISYIPIKNKCSIVPNGSWKTLQCRDPRIYQEIDIRWQIV